MFNQVALVSQTDKVSFRDLGLVSAAIQKQVTRDLGPIWNVDATVDAFETLPDVPVGYWPVIVRDDIPFDAGGIHLNRANGQPFALVRFSDEWSVTTSHETLEMLVDPSGNRTVASNSPKPDQGRVLIVVEVCDPSEASEFGYSVNGIQVSDFYTPRFFDPLPAAGARYSFSGALTAPRQVRDGGYISWWDPISKRVFQQFVDAGASDFVDRGEVPAGFGTLRSFADRFTNERRMRVTDNVRDGLMLTGTIRGLKKKDTRLDESTRAAAEGLSDQIAEIVRPK